MTCATCMFFYRLGPKPEAGQRDDRTGQCCRYPPRIINAQLLRTQAMLGVAGSGGEPAFDLAAIEEASLFPLTQPSSRCGEYCGGAPL